MNHKLQIDTVISIIRSPKKIILDQKKIQPVIMMEDSFPKIQAVIQAVKIQSIDLSKVGQFCP